MAVPWRRPYPPPRTFVAYRPPIRLRALLEVGFRPASYHPTCLGFKNAQDMTGGSTMSWSCPHHECSECGRKAAAVGGLLFRCSVCPSAFCEDHLPLDTLIINKCARFFALGQRHPAQACFVLCSPDCAKFSKKRIVTGLENGATQTVIVGAAAGIRAGASGSASASASKSTSAAAQQDYQLPPTASPAATPLQSPAISGAEKAVLKAAAKVSTPAAAVCNRI